MTEPVPELPGWLRPNARVAIVHGHGSSTTVKFDVVEKIGKLHITLEKDEEKYRVKNLTGVRKRGPFDSYPKLADPDSAEVKAILAARRLDRARLDVHSKHDAWRRASGTADELAMLTALSGSIRFLERLLHR